ncbi:HAUS augmin-like complex subunit 2 isoform X1 [Sphaerodactylus townsendi]|uniref:HAUS augmin-like complex subunit 2 isoform X1 n=1 Tax=Sphaerodactylus townsendi TaxID=933632 RepID=UPI00202695DF|nr:HAUS augmin-like complex subunit 2 isoform X1 [Sphaerodactylus townsendi]
MAGKVRARFRGRTLSVMTSCNPWDPAQPAAAGLILSRCLSLGTVSQETLDACGKPRPCLVHLSEAEQIVDHQAEINQNNLDTEILQIEKETADIVHPFYLTQKCQVLQGMNRHLDAVLKEKRALRQRLMKSLCQDSLPIEADFHRYAVKLLALAVVSIQKLETRLIAIRSIPQIPPTIKKMDSELTKMDLLVTETEELAEQIFKWREKQMGIFCFNSQLTVVSDSLFRSGTP